MKKSVIVWIVVAAVVAIIVIWLVGAYNGLVRSDEGVSKAWAQVENVYQRRADLIPNLVNTVSGAANFERGTLREVVEARAAATSIKLDPSKLTPENIAAFQKAQDGLGSALGRLLMITENYPDIKSSKNFLELQAQIEGSENRISVERGKFNEQVRDYNTRVRRFPSNIIARSYGFATRGYFEAKPGAENAPEVKFDY